MKRFGISILTVGLAAFVACDSPETSTRASTVTDSAGVEIVRSVDRPTALIRIDSVPDLSIGGAEAEGPAAFGRIENVVVGPDDSIWVSDRQGADVRVFNPDGSHRVTVGGRGDGPGEFRIVRLLGAAGDSVAVQDDVSRQLNWYALNGERLSGVRVTSAEGSNPLLYDVTSDGRLVGLESRTISASELGSGATFGGTVPFVIWDAPESPPTQFTIEPTAVFLWDGDRVTTALPFTANAQLDAGRQIDVVAGSAFRVRRFDSNGRLIRVATVDRDPVPVDGSARADLRTFIENALAPRQRGAALEALSHPDVPEFAPAYRLIVQGEDGSSWAYRFNASVPGGQPWDVFLPDGSFAGSLTLPDGFSLRAATEDFIYGYWTDDLGVQHVRRHRIVHS